MAEDVRERSINTLKMLERKEGRAKLDVMSCHCFQVFYDAFIAADKHRFPHGGIISRPLYYISASEEMRVQATEWEETSKLKLW